MKRKIENTARQLEKRVPFSQSILWSLQRQYFEEKGMEAWRTGEVPHYVTTNPRQANCYAEMIAALWKDHIVQSAGSEQALEPIRILELGGGSGRLAFYLLRRLDVLCKQEGIPRHAFRYILTDFTQSNLDFWRNHPRFQPYFEAEALDIALFDVENPGAIHLQISDTMLEAPNFTSPIVVVANYLFDSIPQELLYVEESAWHSVLVTTQLPSEQAELSPAEKLEKLQLDYTLAAAQDPSLNEEPYAALIQDYLGHAERAFILFPKIAIRCLAFLQSLSQKGMLLLTADKGGHELKSVVFPSPPLMASHGSISMNVNYHALLSYCVGKGGFHLFPNHPCNSINTGCMLFLENVSIYSTTLNAARKQMLETGPDTYFTIYKCLRAHLETVQICDLMAALRLSLYDSHQLNIYIQRIGALLPQINHPEAADLLRVMHFCWENYFALQEGNDLATALGSICYELDAYEWALFYFGQSTDIYGTYTGTFYNMAVCYHMLGDAVNAQYLLQKVVAYDVENEAAWTLLEEYNTQPLAEPDG